ncbi:GntR family transcriptional regulator [Synergistales bacterium]|nr:GntR family transcriptional regulator [Synergistales bacterium]
MNASEQAAKEIIQLLVNHEYYPGSRFFETTLAERMNMSRTPVRAALSNLVTCGFLEKKNSERGYRIPVLEPDDMRLVFETRALLEGALAAQAALNRSDEEVEILQKICDTEKIAFDELDKETYAESNVKFHLSIADFAKNPYLKQCLEQVFWRSRLYDFFMSGFYNKSLTQAQKNEKRSYNEHVSITRCIESRDASGAGEKMREHLKYTYAHISGQSAENVNLDNR